MVFRQVSQPACMGTPQNSSFIRIFHAYYPGYVVMFRVVLMQEANSVWLAKLNLLCTLICIVALLFVKLLAKTGWGKYVEMSGYFSVII